MKSFRNLLLLMVLLSVAASCKKEQVNEVKINDLNGLLSQFKTPDKEYTTAPFFVWNYKITKEEIDKYLTDFKNAGSSQVIIHPRPGLITEYLSDEWFDLYKYAVKKGKELGMNIWMYDENSYPSGFAGGNVPDQMPESYNQGTGLRMTRFETLPDTAEKYFLVLKEDDKGNFADVTSSVAAEKGKQGKYLTFHKTYYSKTDWYAGFSYVDLLRPGVTQKFIDVTMSGYEKVIPEELGTTIPGTFTDEPEIVAPGNSIRWTPDLFDVFRKQWNYDLRTALPSLIEEVGDWKKVRHNYTSTLLSLFIERWAKPWYEYTEQKGLKFTGHYWEHDWPGTRHGGDNMAMYAWHQVPAIDMLFNQFNDSTPGAQFGNVRAIKELASAANQTGRQRKLSETYGGAGWELTFAEQKRLGDWEYALGVNLMNQHLSHITLAGARKYDYPPTFTYHEPWWQDYKYINDHYARLSMALSSGRQINDILVIEPTTTGWLYDSYVKRNPKLSDIGQSFQSFVTRLEKNQVEYDLGSEQIMKDMAGVSDNKLIVGQRAYSTVVIPPMTENLNLSTFKLLAKYVKKGGKLVAFSIPTMIDGSWSPELKEFFETNREKISTPEKLDAEAIEKYFRNGDIRFTDLNGGTLYHQRRVLADGQLLFMVNSDMSGTLKGKVEITGTGAIELNTLKGEVNGFPSKVESNKVSLSFELPPAGSLMLFIPSGNAEIPSVPELFENERTIMADKQAVITRDRENVLTLEFCDLQLGGEKFTELHTYYAADKVYKYFGFRNGNPWNTSVQFKNKTVERDTFGVNSGFTATYRFNVEGTFDMSSFSAVVERPYLWKVSINGNEVKQEPGMWWLDRESGVYRIGSFIKKGDNTLAVTASPMKIHAEIEPVYITGDFSLTPSSKGWTIKKPVKELEPGSWREQGMPFYSWGVTYSNTFTIDKPEGKFELVAGKWNGTIAEVKVNGKAAGPVAFPPYTSDITALLVPGENTMEFTVIGSLKNLLGPHFNNPAPGLVSPGHFRNVKAYPSGTDYQLIDYGLYGDISIINRY